MLSEDYGRLKLLFVDDAPHTRVLLREILRGSRWPLAEVVESAAKAFARIKVNPPDLVFTDWQMPEQSGLDLIRAIRERPDSPDPLLPVILLTAHGNAEHVVAARDAGAAGYLVKPISVSRIVERVTAAVAQQRAFIVSPDYIGPDRRRADRPGDGEHNAADELPPGATVLPPDGLLLAKVRGDRAALREAQVRRAKVIAVVRDALHPRAADEPPQDCPAAAAAAAG